MIDAKPNEPSPALRLARGRALPPAVLLDARVADELRRRLWLAIGPGAPWAPRHGELHRRLLEIALERRRRDGPEPAPLDACLPRHLADVHLAWACARRPFQEHAWERLIAAHGRALNRVARTAGAASPVDETQTFFADLCLPSPRGSTMLDTYSGLAPLGAWLRLVFQRRLLAARRARPHEKAGEPADELSGELADERAPNPELEAGRRDVALLLDRCLAGLSLRDRDLVEARVLRAEEGLATACRHGVSPSYVSRRYFEVLRVLRTRLRSLVGGIAQPGELG